MQSGLAAVRLKIGRAHVGQDQVQMSGFRLGRDAIITCAHFDQWPDAPEAFENMAAQYLSGSNGLSGVAQARDTALGTCGAR